MWSKLLLGLGMIVTVNSQILHSKMEALYYDMLNNNAVKCKLCFRECIIPDGECGFCRVRENCGGKLYSLVYGRTYSWQVAPIEKDGMYHLLPGGKLLAFATASCNFKCKHCHNWTLTQIGPDESEYSHWMPQEIVEYAVKSGCSVISGTINEPTVFYEYLYEVARLAKKRGLKFQFHTNGGINPDPLRALLKYTDGVVVDLKGFTTEFYKDVAQAELSPVLRTLKIIREEGVHLEITNLIIPTYNDDLTKIKSMCQWIKENLDPSVPLHFTRFSPEYKLRHLPQTPLETLEETHRIAKEMGLKYVYIGNVPGHRYNSTFCPSCNKRVIHRIHFKVLKTNVLEGKCKYCGTKIFTVE